MVEGLSQPTVVQQSGSRRINTQVHPPTSFQSPARFHIVRHKPRTREQRGSIDAIHQDRTLWGTEQMQQGGMEVWTGKGKFSGTLALNWNCGEAFAPLELEIQRQIEFGDVSDGDLFLGLRSGMAGSRLDLCWPSLEVHIPFCSSTLCMGSLN